MNKNTTLKIVYTSDVHGHVLPLHYGTKDRAELGLAKYATIIKEKKQENENILLIDNGDLIQGTPLMTHYVQTHAHKQHPMIGIMNKIGLDAAMIGNHEFNFGKELLQRAVNESSFPWLAANIIDQKTGEPYFGPPYLIKTLPNGVRAAILGLTTHYIPNWEQEAHIEGIEFHDAFKTANNWVEKLYEKEQFDLLIVSYHGGLERDPETGEATEVLTGENQAYEIAAKIDGIDILLTGHQHRTFVETIGSCLVIQAGKNAVTYGEVDVEFEKTQGNWTVTSKQAVVNKVKDAEPDRDIIELINDLEASTQIWLDEPIGQVDGDMTITDPFLARIEKHPFIEFMHAVQLEASGADFSVASLFDNEAKGFSRTVTMRDVVTNYKYPNTLAVLSLTGQEIKAALEKSATYFSLDEAGEITVNPAFLHPKPQHYHYDMWENINYTIDVSLPEGERVSAISYEGKPLEPDETYEVVMNSYRASGGGNFHMFKNKPKIKEIQQDMTELIRGYFEKYKTVEAVATRNFSVVK